MQYDPCAAMMRPQVLEALTVLLYLQFVVSGLTKLTKAFAPSISMIGKTLAVASVLHIRS